VIFWDPTGRVIAAGWGETLGPERSLQAAVGGDAEAFLFHNGAAAFLAEATRENPGRYAGYDPALLPDVEGSDELPPQAYRNHWLGPANWLLVHNWAMWFGIDDLQGYNPIQTQRYVEYVDALNGHRQEYHETDVFPAGINSPLLDPLNTRFFVVPADAAARADQAPLVSALPVVYEDEHVLILERPTAFPRAWLVHEAQQVAPGAALPLLADGRIDPRQIALLEVIPPELAPVANAAAEQATVVSYEPDQVELTVQTSSPALLMLSEIWDTGWNATVDGQPAPVLLADHTLRAVPVPAGEHQVVLRYDPLSLKAGIAISLATVAAIIAVWGWLVRRERRHEALA
jgi:hypothetical protein